MNLKNKMNVLIKNGITSNMIVSGVCKPISMIIGYIYVPIVLNYLGDEKYGVWSTILTILSWISYFDIGIGNGLRNKLTEAISENSNRKSKKLISSAYAFISIIMLIATIVFCGVAYIVNWEKVLGVSSIDENLGVIVSMSIVFVAINFILSLCKSVLFALQKAADVSLLELGTQILNLLGVIIVSRYVTSNLFFMALIYGCSLLSVNIICSIVLYAKKRVLCPSIKYVDLNTGKRLTSLGLKFFLIQICALVLFTTDSIIISFLYGAKNVTPYSTVNKLFTIISGIYLAFLTPIWSAVAKAKYEKNWKYLKGMCKRMMLFMIPFGIGDIVLIAIFRPLSLWWLGRELQYTNSLIVLGGIYCALTIWCNTFASISNGLELMKVSMIVAVIQAVVNIPLSIFFARILDMGVSGVLCGTVMAMVISAIVQPIYVYKFLKENMQ